MRQIAVDDDVPDSVLVYRCDDNQGMQLAAPAAKKPLTLATLEIDHVTTAKFNVLDEVLAFQNLDDMKPKSRFNSGTVKKKRLQKFRKKRADGYDLYLKGRSPLTTPVIAGDHIYSSAGFNSHDFYCFKKNSGSFVWGVHLSDDGPSSAIVVDSTILLNTESCTIFALNRFSGKMLWSKYLGDPTISTPFVSGDKVLATYPYYKAHKKAKEFNGIKPSHPLIAMDVKTGKVKWQTWLDGELMVTGVTKGNDIFLTTFPGTLYRINANNGKILAANSMGATSPPSVKGNRVFVSMRADKNGKVKEAIGVLDKKSLGFVKSFAAVDAPWLDHEAQASSKWRKKTNKFDSDNGFASGSVKSGVSLTMQNIGLDNVSGMQLYQPGVVMQSGNYLVSLLGNQLMCVNPVTERVKWKFEVPVDSSMGGSLATSPIIAGNTIITASTKGMVYFVDMNTGKVSRTINCKTEVRNQMIADSGWIYVPTVRGVLRAFDTGDPGITGWPMAYRNTSHDVHL